MLPFEELPLFIQVVLVIGSILVLVIGTRVFWKMFQSAFKDEDIALQKNNLKNRNKTGAVFPKVIVFQSVKNSK